MNTKLLTKEVQGFIQNNLNSNLSTLILKGSPFADVTIQELAQQIEGKQKAFKKLPLWYQTENILFPKKINLEQTSSEATALYKANIVAGNSLIDLTGGFGIDCTYFSKKINEVVHCELNAELSELVTHNTKILNINNLTSIPGDSFETLKTNDKKFDWIYIDPSRRNDAKGKVFLLKDCLPNVPDNLDFLFQYTDNILIKNSPILDITSTIRELKNVKEIHIVALQNEVKELLFVLQKGFTNTIQIKTCNILKENVQEFNFELGVYKLAEYSEPQAYLYEPNAAILKSGAFHQIATKLKVSKLQQHTHLYTSEKRIENFPGRVFKIEEISSYDKKKLGPLLPDKKANITIRNFPETVAQIRKKTKIKDGGSTYLFFTTNIHKKHIVVICSKL